MKATDCKCVVCGKQAVAFWPLIDPDIPSRPYCRVCIDKAKAEVLVGLGWDRKDAKTYLKLIQLFKEQQNANNR